MTIAHDKKVTRKKPAACVLCESITVSKQHLKYYLLTWLTVVTRDQYVMHIDARQEKRVFALFDKCVDYY